MCLSHQAGKAAGGHDAVAPVKAHVVWVQECAVPPGRAQPGRQGPRSFALRGEERIETAKAQFGLFPPEQHAIFGAHGIGAKAADMQAAVLPGEAARCLQPGQRQRGIIEQIGRIGEAFALDHHHQFGRIAARRAAWRGAGRRIARLAPAPPIEQQHRHQAMAGHVAMRVGRGGNGPDRRAAP